VPNIDVKVSAKSIKTDGSEEGVGRHPGDVKDEANKDVTGFDGLAEFVIDIPRDATTLIIKVCYVLSSSLDLQSRVIFSAMLNDTCLKKCEF
jgi:hypothetical protein